MYQFNFVVTGNSWYHANLLLQNVQFVCIIVYIDEDLSLRIYRTFERLNRRVGYDTDSNHKRRKAVNL